MNYINKMLGVMALTAALGMSMTACDDDDDDTEATTTESGVLDLGGYYQLARKTSYGNDWIYVNLAAMDTVSHTESDRYESTDWDIAFNRYNVRTNSGKSGVGKGGAYKTSYTSMSQCTSVPADAEFTTDVEGEVTKSIKISGNTADYQTEESTLNEVLAEGIKFAGPPPTYTPSDNVYLIKDADGNVWKFMALGFCDVKGNSGYYTFEIEKL